MQSTRITIPEPPPYGVSSTLRCRPRPKSRGLLRRTRRAPAWTARPTMPSARKGWKSSGKSVTTETRTARAYSSPSSVTSSTTPRSTSTRFTYASRSGTSIRFPPPSRSTRRTSHVGYDVSAGDAPHGLARGEHHLGALDVARVELAVLRGR